MLKVIKVIFSVLYVTLAEELYDVTTVYHIGTNYNNTNEEKSVEVHLRTNARGLPIFYQGKVVDDFIIGRVFPAMNVSVNHENNNSLWQTKGWTRKVEFESLFYNGGVNPKSITVGTNISKIQPLPRIMSVELVGHIGDDWGSANKFKLLIFSHETELKASQPDFYTIMFSYINSMGYLMHCSTEYGDQEVYYYRDTDGNDIYKNCKHTDTFHTENWIYNTDDATNSFVLDFSNGGVQLWSDLLQLNKVLDWKPSQEYPPIKPKYFSMYYSGGDIYNLNARFSSNAVLESNSSNSSPLISPWFTADLDHLCLAVVAKGFIGFNVKAENAEGSRFKLDFEEVNLYQKSWVVLHLTTPLPEQLKGSNIRLVLTPTSNDVFSIQRISSCNAQEEGDVALLSSEELKAIAPSKNKEIIFDVYSDNGYKDSRWCFKNIHQLNSNVTITSNGGCKNGSTFACPPGFVGDKCETACGRNSFGLDCGGICSLHPEECKGTRLCTAAMGCHCAPGFYGETCEEQCELGKYGNDCVQTCGQCAEPNNCDIYTGHCATCVPGYFPPYCKDTYPVVKNAPIVSTPSFGQAEITPILSGYSGRGVPTMYQIQYRESKQEIRTWTIQETFYNLSDIVTTTIQGIIPRKFYEVRVILFDDNSNNYQGEDVPTTKFSFLCEIPDSMDYYITSTVNTTSMTISWDYKNTSEYWCPIQHYQVSRKEKYKWITENTTDTSFTFETDLISGRIVKFKVQAFTSLGVAPVSKPVSVSTVVKGRPNDHNRR